MTTKTWKGTSGSTASPKSGNWSKPRNWSPTGAPAAGDDVIIGGSSTYTLTLDVPATVNSLTINDSGATLAIGAFTLNVTGTINDQFGGITIAGGKISAAGGLTLASGTSLSGWGTVVAPLSGSGTVTASGGTLDLSGTGSGITFAIATASASDLKIDGTATTASAILFSSINQTLEIGAAGSLTIGAAETISNGNIQLDGGTLTDTDVSGITFGSGATLSGNGTLFAALSGGGTITANGGTLEFKNAVDSSASSAFQIANVSGSDLQFDSTVGTGGINPTVAFNGANGVLDLSHTTLGNFDGVVANFGTGDGIEVMGATSVSLDSTGTKLTVSGTAGSLGTITFASSYSGDTFSVSNNGTVGTISVSVPTPPTVTVSDVISGPTDSNNATLNGYNAIPPDNALAVSANDVLMAENNVIEITSRTGTVLLSPESSSTFFASVDSGYSLTDPRAVVDPVSGTFIVTSDALNTNSSGAVTGSAVVYAISKTTDPVSGGWTFGSVNTTQTINGLTTWGDQPTIASNGTDLDITTAQFGVSSGQYVDNYVTIVPLSGGSPTAYNLGSAADYRPVAVAGGDYLVGYTGDGLSILYNSNGADTFASSSLSLGSIDVGNGSYTAPQRGSSVLLDAGSNDVASAVYANGDIYAVFEVIPPGGTTQPDVHWVKAAVSVDSSGGLSSSLVAQGDITSPSGAVAFNPSIAIDANGDVLVNYTASSSSMYPTAYASVMPAGSLSFLAPVQYGSSVAPETATFGVTNNVIRWGDYSSAVADPAAPNSFVVSNEIVPSAQNIFNNAPWGTATATITLSPGTSGAVVASGSTTTNPTSSNATDTSISPLKPAVDHSFSFADIGNLGGGDGSRDPYGSASLGLPVSFASAFPRSSHGYGGTSIVDPTTLTIADSLKLTSPHA